MSHPVTASSGSGTTPPTVLYLDNSSTFGGAIVSLKHLVRVLARRGVRPVVVSGHPDQTLRDSFPGASVHSVEIRMPGRNPTALLRRMRKAPPGSELVEKLGLRLAAADWHLRQTLPTALRYANIGREHDVDLVHLNNIVGGQLDGLLAAKLLGVPCVAHARGFQSPGVLLKTACRHVDRHVAISSAIARNLGEIGADPENISVIPDGIDVTGFSAARNTAAVRRDLGIPEGAPAFGLFGRIIEWKGVREFVRASARVLQQLPSARALIVGDVSDGDASYLREVREIARATGYSDRILFTGYRDDVPALMQALDLVVHASIEPEPFGMVVIEAMAAGTPVVAADAGGPRDIVVEGKTGHLVDPTNTEELASAIRELLEEPDRAGAMGRAGQDRARRLYGNERYADGIMEVYQDVREQRAIRVQ